MFPPSFDMNTLGEPKLATPTKIRGVPDGFLVLVSKVTQPTPTISLLYPLPSVSVVRLVKQVEMLTYR